MISQEFVDVFNRAASLAREGQLNQALELYETLLRRDDTNSQTDAKVTTGEFLGVVELRRAYCYMDLKKFADARQVLESEQMRLFSSQFDFETMFDYFFTLANVHGNMGKTQLMDEAMTRAMTIAAEHLGDLKRCESCWYYLMHWGREHHQWEFLEQQCISAHMFGRENGSAYLQGRALEFGCYAYRGLGKNEQAKKGAEVVLQRLKNVSPDSKAIAEWQDFLQTVA